MSRWSRRHRAGGTFGGGWEFDADTKLCVSYLIGDRSRGSAFALILDCAERIVGRPQLTDALNLYPDAVEEVFGSNVDYAQLHKIYGVPTEEGCRRIPRPVASAAT